MWRKPAIASKRTGRRIGGIGAYKSDKKFGMTVFLMEALVNLPFCTRTKLNFEEKCHEKNAENSTSEPVDL